MTRFGKDVLNLMQQGFYTSFGRFVNREEAEDDPYYANMFANEKEVIDWGPRYRFDSLLKPRNKSSIKGKRLLTGTLLHKLL